MTSSGPGVQDRKREAFRLFEEGRYRESLQLCEEVLGTDHDPHIEVLAAMNMYHEGRTEDAEVAFRDLARKMPESSYVHSYLAKVLAVREDENAFAEYSTAVQLDPENQDALRSYAEYLINHRDFFGALPVLRRLVEMNHWPQDTQNLMLVFNELGHHQEALALCDGRSGDLTRTVEYVDALLGSGRPAEAVQVVRDIFGPSHDLKGQRKYLQALSKADPSAAHEAYTAAISEATDSSVIFDYVLFLRSQGCIKEALTVAQTLCNKTPIPLYRLTECDLLAESGDQETALVAYERLIRDELALKNDMEALGWIIGTYRSFLTTCRSREEAIKRFVALVSEDVNVVSLLETARFFRDAGLMAEARSWYYRAYRSDFLTGGLEYAQFLVTSKEEREAEKVLLYILTNAKKVSDLTRVADVAVGNRSMHHLERLMDQLIVRMSEQQANLGSAGLDRLAGAMHLAAENAYANNDFATCKYYCLRGIDVMPPHTANRHSEKFLGLIRTCKEKMVADRPIIQEKSAKNPKVAPPERDQFSLLELTDQEEKVLKFLRSHKRATEMDLRGLLGTRRAVGVLNQLLRKSAAQGLHLVEKQGLGKDGEVYEYTGI